MELNQGRRASRLPLAFIFRAFGAVIDLARLSTPTLAFIFRAFSAVIDLARLSSALTNYANASTTRNE